MKLFNQRENNKNKSFYKNEVEREVKTFRLFRYNIKNSKKDN